MALWKRINKTDRVKEKRSLRRSRAYMGLSLKLYPHWMESLADMYSRTYSSYFSHLADQPVKKVPSKKIMTIQT